MVPLPDAPPQEAPVEAPVRSLDPRRAPDAFGGLDERTSTHLLTILSVASGMVGVCLTAIGLLGIARSLTKLETVCDDVLAANSLVYLASAGLSFACLRTRLGSVARWSTLAVDALFCCGLALTVAACVLLVWFVA